MVRGRGREGWEEGGREGWEEGIGGREGEREREEGGNEGEGEERMKAGTENIYRRPSPQQCECCCLWH